jgi:hypothetical protein
MYPYFGFPYSGYGYPYGNLFPYGGMGGGWGNWGVMGDAVAHASQDEAGPVATGWWNSYGGYGHGGYGGWGHGGGWGGWRGQGYPTSNPFSCNPYMDPYSYGYVY